MKMADDYRGQPINIRQGQPFESWSRIGFTVLKVLPELYGEPWNEVALGYVHALRPSHVRVVIDGTQLDAQPWRVTVYLEPDNQTIRKISQEVKVGLPDGIRHGQELDEALRNERS